jgi:CRISPR-associated endoribonuclease Cas6
LRALIELEVSASFPYDLSYHHTLQGFIYRQIKGTEYDRLHDQEGSRFFSFSNLIPPSPSLQKGSRRVLIIASPDSRFVGELVGRLFELMGKEVRIGDMRFIVRDVRQFPVELPRDEFCEFTLTSGTPIVIRIPRYRYEEYGIKPKRDYDYAYWRKEYSPTAFVKQLEENLRKRYTQFSGNKSESDSIFHSFRFKKQVAIPLFMKGNESTVIGTLWEFHLQALNREKRDILQFGLDAGFGEMNSLGFGFMNLAEVENCHS